MAVWVYMEYELAKELKDAGFDFRYLTDEEPTPFLEDLSWSWHVPTLSELIEACGDIVLWKNSNGWHSAQGDENMVGDTYVDDSWPHSSSHGQTPEEAVGRLWLSLNKK